MPIVEAYDDSEDSKPLFTAEFDFMPRLGEHLSRDTPPGYFVYYEVVEIWHRQDNESEAFRACIGLRLKD